MKNAPSGVHSNSSHCWQYHVRQKNLKQDLRELGVDAGEVSKLKVRDFSFAYVPKSDREQCQKIKEFIIKHEWLGKMPHRPTHRFIASYRGRLAGVVIMATPNAFSYLLGKDSRDREKLISRGACISWSPKNLASALVMFSIRWMAKNTSYRLFTAYADPEARELGTIYQACNFLYLGQNSGARFKYFDDREPERGWFDDRIFRKSTSFKKYALELGIGWQRSWGYRDKICWGSIPLAVATALKKAEREHQRHCRRKLVPRKHKYVYILGSSKNETRGLRARFWEMNPNKVNLPYPKTRGHSLEEGLREDVLREVGNNGVVSPPSSVVNGEDPKSSAKVVPLPPKRFWSVREVAQLYGLSLWMIYQHINSDPTFPFVNIGHKKRFLIDLKGFERWIRKRGEKGLGQGAPCSEPLSRASVPLVQRQGIGRKLLPSFCVFSPCSLFWV